MRCRKILLAAVCAGVVGIYQQAAAQTETPAPPSFPLYCQGPLRTISGSPALTAYTLTPFKWSGKGAGAETPGIGECAWADRGPRGTEIRPGDGNVICGALGQVADLQAGKYAEIGVYRNASADDCLAVTKVVGFVRPPFSASPVLP
jgi:hypothetical protein